MAQGGNRSAAWHPDHELRATDLVALEEYLLARAALIDEDAHGVNRLDWTESVTLVASEGVQKIVVTKLVGVTPAGEPVRLVAGESVEAALTAEARDASAWDLAIEVNSREAEAPKLMLRVERVGSDGEPVCPAEQPHRLYLGRYRMGGTTGLENTQRPLVRRLDACRPLDEAWKAWVSPLLTRLQALLADLENSRESKDATASVLQGELARLSFEWLSQPLPALARRLLFVGSLAGRQGNKWDVVQSLEPATDGFPPPDATGDALPAILARLLPAGEVEPQGLPLFLSQLLEGLHPKLGVDLRVPLESLRRWGQAVVDARRGQVSDDAARDLEEQIAAVLERRARSGRLDDWSRAFALFSVLDVIASTGRTVPGDRLGGILETTGADANQSAASILDAIYAAAREVPAGPMAFFWLARVAECFPEIIGRTGLDPREYFGLLRAPSAMDADRRSQSPPDRRGEPNRVLRHLVARSEEVKEVAVEPDLECLRSGGGRSASGLAGQIRVAIVGHTGSGKSTLVEELVAAWADPRAPRIPGEPQLSQPRETDDRDGTRIVEGKVILAGEVHTLTMQDTRGTWLSRAASSDSVAVLDALSRVLDLLVVAIEPASLDGPDPVGVGVEHIAGIVRTVLTRNPSALVALAYTKADEYGTISPGVIRLAAKEQVPLLRQFQRAGASHDKEWADFATAAGRIEDVHEYDRARVKRPAYLGDGEEWAKTRTRILTKTRPLWEATICRPVPALLNGYFVAARPHDPCLEPRSRRGFLQLFTDYFAHVQQRKGTASAGSKRVQGRLT